MFYTLLFLPITYIENHKEEIYFLLIEKTKTLKNIFLGPGARKNLSVIDPHTT